jgi:hypothetical protein
MKDLLELAQIVTPTKLRQVELLSASSNGETPSRIQEFYNLLQDCAVSSDDEAAQRFYNTDKSASSYQKLRTTVKDRMVNALFMIDLKKASYTDRQTAYYESYKEWAAAKILYGKNARTAAVSLSRKLIKIAKKFEFTELLVDIYHTLRLYHGTIEGDYKKFSQYNTSFKEYEKIWREENQAEELYIDLSIGFVNAKATDTEIKEKADRYYLLLMQSLEEYDTYHLHLCGRLVEVSRYTSVNDYSGALDVCDRAIAFFEKKKYHASVPLQIFHYQKLICHLQLQQYDVAMKAAGKCEGLLTQGTFNWFKVQETYFLLYSREGQYERASKVIQKAVGHPQFENLPENIRETWLIAEGYIFFLKKAGVPGKFNTTDNNFRLSRFLNEMSVFSKDKKGMNITILILEWIIKIADKDFDYLIDRAEATDKYRKRYLRNPSTERSANFLKLLLHVPRYAYDPALLKQKSAKDLQSLKEQPIESANQSFEIEIIPYEQLWEIIIKLLDRP